MITVYEYDAIIVGSGVAGMTCAIYLKRAGLNILVIENNTPGGQLNRSSIIENYPGFKEIDGPSLAFNIYEQVTALNVEYLFDKVVSLDISDDIKKVKTTKKELTCKYLVIATGRSPRQLKIENIDKLTGKGISYCALCDGNLYKDEDVAVVGGGASALEEAIYLSNICKTVTLINKNDLFKSEEELIKQALNKGNIKIIYKANIIKCISNKDKLSSIILDNDEEIKVKALFIAIGSKPVLIGNIKNENNYIIVNNYGMTSVNNVFACGDIIKKKIYQITSAVGEATIVAGEIIRLNKNK